MPTPTIQGFQLSPQQKRLWLLQQNGSVYLTQGAISIEGNLDPDKLKQIVEQIVARHQILRTSFSRLPGIKLPVMTIVERNWFDWSEINVENDRFDLEELFERSRQQEYNLETEPILKLSLFRFTPASYILHITLPALCGDLWTLKNLFNEIADGYCKQEASQSLESALQYVQFSEWQNQLLTDEDGETAQKFWQQQVESLSELKLPGERQIKKASPRKVRSLKIENTPEVTEKIATIAQKYHTTLAKVLLSCWQILIWRLTEESNITIGAECDRREYEEMQPIMGLLATSLPITSDLTADLSFAEVLEKNKQLWESVEEWQDYFVPKSFLPIGFEYQQLPSANNTGELAFSYLKQSSWIEKCKLKLCGIHGDNGLQLEINYDLDCFSSEAIASIARQFKTLLADVTQNPQTRIDRLTILPESDRQRIFQEFNQTLEDYRVDKCIHQLFEEQAQKTPNNLAVISEQEQLTYTQLNCQANQLASYLRKRGVKPETLVGLYLEKSPWSIVGLLGILKAGGAYLPLDTNLPTTALSDRLEANKIILTQQKLASALPQSTIDTICLDEAWQDIEQENTTNLSNETAKENLAYVLYTSGSTGKPKGVAIEHQQLLNYYHAVTERLNLSANQNFALASSLAADLGNTVIFPALLTGGCLHLIDPERATNPQAFVEYSDRHNLDCLKIVPSHLKALLDVAEPQKILPTKCLILGGEALSWQLASEIQKYQPNCQIFNHYGPTETTVGVLVYQVDGKNLTDSDSSASYSQDNANTVPIGKPLANNQIYLLDRQLQPVPIGVPGEIYIGGAQVSRGYLDRAELTAKKFVENPLPHQSSTSNHRLYQTGDKARYLEDGNIEFLGRIDRQVKIRGYRIELGEIESALEQHPSVRLSTVTVREDKPGDRQIVAYIVFKEQFTKTNVSQLRDYLQQRLPEYTIPSAFVRLDSLPYFPNGKIDFKALPVPEITRKNLSTSFVAPQTSTEKTIAKIWLEILDVERVGIHDEFLELGGHSLIATQIVSRIRETLQTDLSLRQFFETPTVAGLAATVTQNLAEQTDEKKLDELLAELEGLSEEKTEQLLAAD